MQFLTRLFGLDSNSSSTRRAARPRHRNRAQFRLESLEERDLKSDIPGVSIQWGYLAISATQSSNNSASVSYDQSNGKVLVTLNNQSEEFNPGDIWGISYSGGAWGSDSFSNSTNLASTVVANGGNNHISGGSSYNLVYLWGDSNSYAAAPGANSYVYAFNGPNDSIDSRSSNMVVTSSNFSSWW